MLSIQHLGDFLCQFNGDKSNIWIGFDVKGHGQLRKDLNSLLPMNLLEGYDGRFPDQDEKFKTIEVMLQWLIAKSPEGDLEKVLDGAQFVCRRGILTRMSVGLQLKKNGKGDWAIIAEQRNGVIYLQERKSEWKKAYDSNIDENGKRGTYMGRRFEEYLVIPPETDASSSSQVKIDVRMVIMAKIGGKKKENFKLLYSGEVDAVDEDGKYVELKTQKYALSGHWYLKEKSLKWWLQSKFTGVDYLLVGLKNDNGIVSKLEKVSLDSLKNSNWCGDDCLRSLRNVLQYITKNLPEGEARNFSCNSGNLHCEPTNHRIVSDEFIRHFDLE